MEGSLINQWVEKLMPKFNGEYTLGELTEGLPTPYKNKVYEIGETLFTYGFVRDMSQDRPHQLESKILKKYASQIEFIENFIDSGAFRFQMYRQTKVLVVGSGSFFVSLVSALIESGLPKFHIMVKDLTSTNKVRLKELVENAYKNDPEVAIEELPPQKIDNRNYWGKVIQPFEWVLYVSQEGNIEELRELHAVCRIQKKAFISSICLQQLGIAGPLVHPDTEACWESMWRRIHRPEFYISQHSQTISFTGEEMLGNVMAFELFKKITGVTKNVQNHPFFLLNLETLEGEWHPFFKHPMVTDGHMRFEFVQDLDLRLKQDLVRDERSQLFHYFSELTSTKTGIFHIWEEGDLKQLPLAQCYVQSVNPRSEGPAELLSKIICTGLTHDEARREAGMAGIEMYVSQLIDLPISTSFNQKKKGDIIIAEEFVGVGTGETITEGICRGLQRYLDKELGKRQINQKEFIYQIHLSEVKDKRCRFYLQALTIIQGVPVIGLGKNVLGFPVVWVGTGGHWYSSTSLNITMALQRALQEVLINLQNQVASTRIQELTDSSVLLREQETLKIEIPACEETSQRDVLNYAIRILEGNNMRILALDLAVEPFLKEQLAGVWGVLLRGEEF